MLLGCHIVSIISPIKFRAEEKQRRRKRGMLISFVVRRRFGDEGFLCRGKGEKKRNEKTFGIPALCVQKFAYKRKGRATRTNFVRKTRALRRPRYAYKLQFVRIARPSVLYAQLFEGAFAREEAVSLGSKWVPSLATP
jgi:hypothetical protein